MEVGLVCTMAQDGGHSLSLFALLTVEIYRRGEVMELQ